MGCPNKTRNTVLTYITPHNDAYHFQKWRCLVLLRRKVAVRLLFIYSQSS